MVMASIASEEIYVECSCGEKTILHNPCSDKSAQSQLKWLFEHLKKHRGISNVALADLTFSMMSQPPESLEDITDEQ